MSDIPRRIVLDRRKGRGPYRFLLLPGLVPDGPHTFLLQRKVFKKFGGSVTFTYPYDHYDLERTLATITEELDRAVAEGAKPVLVGVSVGGGLVLELLRRARERGQHLAVGGIILISPLTSPDDLSPLLKRLLAPIFAEAEKPGGAPERALQRGRQFFMSLASRSAGTKARPTGFQRIVSLLTPSGLIALRDHALREEIEASLTRVHDRAAVERVLALRAYRGVHDLVKAQLPLTPAPTLILWGSKERHTLDMDGPGGRLLSRPDLAHQHFPDLEVQWVYNPDGDPAPHASLLKHAKAFNKHLKRFCKRLGATRSASED